MNVRTAIGGFSIGTGVLLAGIGASAMASDSPVSDSTEHARKLVVGAGVLAAGQGALIIGGRGPAIVGAVAALAGLAYIGASYFD